MDARSVVGRKVGRLMAVRLLNARTLICVCSCGNTRTCQPSHFRAGYLKSCGCHVVRHGHGKTGDKSREYICYYNMLARCHNPNNKRYADYGGKGIVVCAEWRNSFMAFLADMGPCPEGYTIDRIDNSNGYSPDNCRWVSRQTNQRNREISMVWIVYGVRYPTAADAAKAHRVSTATIAAWCKGRLTVHGYYPPKPNCRIEQS